ncbi:hypothetical protein IT568_03505, partial [bacterium]|nr:hypothetical protein [bacterium]
KTTNGYFGEASFTIPGILTATAAFSDMLGNKDSNGKTVHDQSIYGEAGIDENLSKKFKIAKASLYYQQTHVDNAFKFTKQTESTIWGYKLGYAIAENASLIFDWQHHYTPDSNTKSGYRRERTVTIETVISF